LNYYRPILFSEIGRVDGGECDAIVKFPYPHEVDVFKSRINAIVQSMDAGVKSCKGLPESELQAWNSFLIEWTTFANKPTPTFGAYGDWVQTCTYSATIDAWRDKLNQYCKLPGPENIKASGSADLVKWLTVGAIALGGTVLLLTYAPEIKGALGLAKRR
jgi:hypothetical protein